MSASVLQEVSRQLRRNDVSQLLAGYMALLAFVLVVTWPQPQSANNSWYALVQTRLVALLLIGLQLGARARREPLGERLGSLLGLCVLLLLSLPLDIAAYAASFPGIPWLWNLTVTWVDVVAFFGVGFFVARLLGRLGQGIILTMALLVIFVASLAADLLIGVKIFNPLAALTTVSPLHLGLMSLVAVATLWRLFRKDARDRGVEAP